MVFWFGKSWWVLIFCLLSGVCYLQASSNKKALIYDLQTKALQLQTEKDQALKMREDLELKIASNADPAWIELVLLREVGVVPEGYLKVHFK
jgi:hypothetical protein